MIARMIFPYIITCRWVVATCLLSTMLVSCGNAAGNRWRQEEGVIWNTTYHVVYQSSKDLSGIVVAVADSINASLSPFKHNSVISRINRGESTTVDRSVREVFERAKYYNRLSGGMFDPTVAPLVNLWGFGYEGGDVEPSKAQIDSALCLVGISDCYIVGNSIVKRSPNTQFNFSALAKGYGVDCIARAFEREGVENYMIEVGGEIVVSGVNSQGQLWAIGIDMPVRDAAPGEATADVVRLSNAAVATSGNYRNYRQYNGSEVGHTISPVTGYPVKGNVLSATVIAPRCVDADALATTLMVMSADDGRQLIDSLGEGYKAIVVKSNINGEIEVEEWGKGGK